MARIHIDIPEPFIYTTTIDTRISDINYGHHVGHDTLISILHEARVRFLNHHGFNEGDINGTGLVIADMAVAYLSQSFYPDQLQIDITVADFNQYGCDIYYQASRAATRKILLKAKTGIVFFDYHNAKVAPIPDGFIQKIKSGT